MAKEDQSHGRGTPEQGVEPAPSRRSLVWPLVATFMTAVVVGHLISLKRRLLNFERIQQANSTKHGAGYGSSQHYSFWGYERGRPYGREGFQHKENVDTWSKRDRQSWEIHMEELERLERIRRMQEAFFRERSGNSRSYEKWQEGWKEAQQNNRDDWYWKGQDRDTWRKEKAKYDSAKSTHKTPQTSHHYAVLGLDPSRAQLYSDAEIKAAFRVKAMEYHPDRNQHRKEYAEMKFREALESYEALKKQSNTNTGNR